ncbi:MAG TPA: DUF2059 domain-containing protein [Roseiarcus sp.]|nr:DUF2059 domain-containing protein [Roseiarcus sp.]
MKAQRSFILAASAAALIAVSSFAPAFADDPSPAALAEARTVIIASGISRSFDNVVPQMLGLLERNVLATRPEIKDKLHATLLQLEPEFVKTEDSVIDAAAASLAKRMSEAELKDVVAFFQSPSGKKYVEQTPANLTDIVAAMEAWRQKLSTDIMTRVRDEMKKQGVDL